MWALGLTGRYFGRQAAHRGQGSRPSGGILINLSRDSCLSSLRLASESSNGPILLSAVHSWVEWVCKDIVARIDFQLGTNEAHLTVNAGAWQALRLFRLAAQYGAYLQHCEEGAKRPYPGGCAHFEHSNEG
ncbi:hypothetical protein D3C76_1438390 [compost metagenome]